MVKAGNVALGALMAGGYDNIVRLLGFHTIYVSNRPFRNRTCKVDALRPGFPQISKHQGQPLVLL